MPCRRRYHSLDRIVSGVQQVLLLHSQVAPSTCSYLSNMSTLPRIDTLAQATVTERAQVLDLLFEPCTQLHTLALETLRINTFESYDELADVVGEQLYKLHDSSLQSDRRWLDAILVAHPRLGEKRVDSVQSRAEQAQLQARSDEERSLAALNERYEQIFPGLRYV